MEKSLKIYLTLLDGMILLMFLFMEEELKISHLMIHISLILNHSHGERFSQWNNLPQDMVIVLFEMKINKLIFLEDVI